MSVTTYLPGKNPAPGMPPSPHGVDSLGIRRQGGVMQGKLSAKEAFALDKMVGLIDTQGNRAGTFEIWALDFNRDGQRVRC